MSGLTLSQTLAVRASGRVLVSAGAGSGKTHTLVERCIDRMLNAEPRAGVDSLLIVTFTNAAAAEMKQRLRQRLSEEMLKHPTDPWLEEQVALVNGALIGTLHSFCLSLVREHFEELGLDPAVVVLDAVESRSLARDVLRKIFSQHFELPHDQNDGLQRLVVRLTDRNPEALFDLVLKIYGKVIAFPNPIAWLRRIQHQIENQHVPYEASFRREALAFLKRVWLPGLELADQENLSRCADVLSRVIETSTDEDCARSMQSLMHEFHNWKRGDKGKFRDPFEGLFLAAQFLIDSKTSKTVDSEAIDLDESETMQTCLDLAILVLEFQETFARAKRDRGGVDFNDLEQFALELLWNSEVNGPTPLALKCRERFRYVFVDEYQDINRAQDLLIQSITSPAGDCFLVGDVKQSIYRFRHADPTIFQNYLREWGCPNSCLGQVISLNENFRSHEGLIRFVNQVFGRLMTPGCAGIDFIRIGGLEMGARELRPEHQADVASGIKAHEARVRLLLFDNIGGDPQEDSVENEDIAIGSMEAEAAGIAIEAQRMVANKLPVWDRKLRQLRSCRWSDIVVLVRSAKGMADSFVKVCTKQGIPVAVGRSGFFEQTEVLDILNLLRVLDNPYHDLALLSLMRSPIGEFDVNSLAAIRASAPKGSLWEALRRLASGIRALPADAPMSKNRALDLAERLVERIRRWRSQTWAESLTQTVNSVVAETYYLDWLRCQDRPSQRLGNLGRLLAMMENFDPLKRQGLYRFLKHVDSLIQNPSDAEVPSVTTNDDAIQLMTIHSSKGLEFPVVFVAGLNRRFNLSDRSSKVLFARNPETGAPLGFALQSRVAGTDRVYPTLPYWLAQQQEMEETLREEIRLLYVAMTRAVDRLVLMIPQPKDSTSKRWVDLSGERVLPHEWLRSRSYLDWLGPTITGLTGDAGWFGQDRGSSNDIAWERMPGSRLESSQACVLQPPLNRTHETVSPECIENMVSTWQQLDFKYLHQAATASIAKTTVTRLRLSWLTRDEESLDQFPIPPEFNAFELSESDAKSARGSTLSSAERGVINHCFLQYLDMARTETLEDLKLQAQTLVDRQLLRPEQLADLDYIGIFTFWGSELGRKIRMAPGLVHRELAFTAGFRPDELCAEGLKDEVLIVQGMVDLAWISPMEIWIVDFKSGKIDENALPSEVERYRSQVSIYALALERIYKRPVTRKLLHFLSIGRSIDV